MAEEEKHHHHHLFHHKKEGEEENIVDEAAAHKYEKEEKHHKHLEKVGELGAAAAGAYALVINISTYSIHECLSLLFFFFFKKNSFSTKYPFSFDYVFWVFNKIIIGVIWYFSLFVKNFLFIVY